MTDQQSDNGFPVFPVHQKSATQNIGFRLGDESFRCTDVPPARVWEGLAADLIPPERITGFIDTVLATEEDRARFNALMENPDQVVSLDTLRDVVIYLVERYGARPTIGPSGFTAGPQDDGLSSTATSASTESTSQPSLSDEG